MPSAMQMPNGTACAPPLPRRRPRAREADLTTKRDDVRKRADYLRHVAKEIREAAPKAGEDEALAAEVKRLSNVEELTKVSSQLAEILDGDEGGTLEAIGAATRLM